MLYIYIPPKLRGTKEHKTSNSGYAGPPIAWLEYPNISGTLIDATQSKHEE